MKIVYDEQAFMGQKYGGISRYFVELALRIAQLPGHDVQVYSPTFVNQYLRAKKELSVFGIAVRQNSEKGYVPGAGRLAALIEPWYYSITKPDIIHETYYQKGQKKHYTRTVLTVYDMIHELYPQFFRANDPTSALKRFAVRKADHIICISNKTRCDLLNWIAVPEEKVSVVHLGGQTSDLFLKPSGAFADQPYLLYVGLRDGYKNFCGFIEAFAKSPRLRRDFSIACYGGPRFTQEEMAAWALLGLDKGQVVHYEGTTGSLAALYANARALVYPSLYEGFGVPPLEAMSLGCPVVCGDNGSAPEVVGNAALTCDTTNVEALCSAVERLAYEDDLRARLIARGHKRVMCFSWDKCASETAAIYHRLCGS